MTPIRSRLIFCVPWQQFTKKAPKAVLLVSSPLVRWSQVTAARGLNMITNTIRMSAVTALSVLASITTAAAAHYSVSGFALEQRIPLNSPNYRSYSCGDSQDFDDYTFCRRTEQRRTSLGTGALSSELLHAKDGTAIYLMENLAPVLLDQSSVEKEISALSREIGQQPRKVDWSRPGSGQPTSVIAVWGRTDLHPVKIDASARDQIKTDSDVGSGLMVDTIGNLVLSAKSGLPVYKIAGGAGYVYSASFDANGRGHRHYVAVDISRPAIEVFEPGLREILQKDQALGGDDYSLWSDVALATRNLSLASSPEIADEELDKVFAGFPSKKLRSHVWSRLPLGTIDSLSGRVHWEVSTYGPNAEHPEIRDAIQKFMTTQPASPFNESIYYTISDSNEALTIIPHTVVASVLRYAIGFVFSAVSFAGCRKAVHVTVDNSGIFRCNRLHAQSLNSQSSVYRGKLLRHQCARFFSSQAATARSWFESVLRGSSFLCRTMPPTI